jgi:hypothetical protein
MENSLTDNEVIAQFAGWTHKPALRYDHSWDYIMPLWHKFRDLDFESVDLDDQHKTLVDMVADAILNKSVNEAFLILVSGVKWYNKQKEEIKENSSSKIEQV